MNILVAYKNILAGSIEVHDCDPEMDCPECDGSGDCVECKGRGENTCKECNGNGQCKDCHGRGNHNCKECGGSGRCQKCAGRGEVSCKSCKGSGRITCPKCNGSGKGLNSTRIDIPGPGTVVHTKYIYDTCSSCHGTGRIVCYKCNGSGRRKCGECKGSGSCSNCKGSGRIKCKHCEGSGNCQNCKGRGLVTCNHCHGNGKCPKCKGRGRVTCTRCEGTGFYQTFLEQTTRVYAHKDEFYTNPEVAKISHQAIGEPVYNEITKQWINRNTQEYDKTKELEMVCSAISKEQYALFAKHSIDNEALHTPDESTHHHYNTNVDVSNIPCTKINYEIEGEEYTLYIIGNNKVVGYDKVPKELKMFAIGNPDIQKKYDKSLKKRVKAMAKLAAYIFQCDGMNASESHLLDCIIKEMNLSKGRAESFRKELSKYNKNMSFEIFSKEISCLFYSKKILPFAWQCMAYDKKISPEEETLFDKLAAKFNLSAPEVQKYKNISSRFKEIDDNNIIKNYADIPNGKKLKYLNTKLILIIISIVVIAFSVFAYLLLTPTSSNFKSNNPYTNEQVKEILDSDSTNVGIEDDSDVEEMEL